MTNDPSDIPEDDLPPELDPEEAAALADAESAWAAGDTAERIAGLEAELADTRDQLLRAAAEMENLRKRTQREQQDARRYAIAEFARDAVSVGDNLARALDAVPEGAREGGDEMVSTLVTGIEMTERQLQQVLERHGVRKFDPMGEKFDPSVHEAMFEVPDAEKPAGLVAHVVEPGYMIGERVLRPARVGVSAGGPKAAPPPPPPPSDASGDGGETPGADTPPGDDISRIGLKIDRSA